MNTKIIEMDPKQFNPTQLNPPAKLLLKGQVVAFPTETVYGLGANAFNSDAVRKIFAAKQRPVDNPLIVHVSSIEMLKECVLDIPEMELFSLLPLMSEILQWHSLSY